MHTSNGGGVALKCLAKHRDSEGNARPSYLWREMCGAQFGAVRRNSAQLFDPDPHRNRYNTWLGNDTHKWFIIELPEFNLKYKVKIHKNHVLKIGPEIGRLFHFAFTISCNVSVTVFDIYKYGDWTGVDFGEVAPDHTPPWPSSLLPSHRRL